MMDLFSGAARLMGMNPMAWARHANPWSVYSRFAGSVFVFFAAWSLHWIGWWSLAPIAVAVLWTWLNPKLFSPPATASSWAARGVLGERAFLNRQQVAIPAEHVQVAWVATGFSGAFLAIGIYGLVVEDFWAAFTGWHAAVLSKIWFVDRMVWLWEEVKDKHPLYAAWDRADWTAEVEGGEPIG